jgi:hypothetical protein
MMNTYKLFLQDLTFLLKEKLEQAKEIETASSPKFLEENTIENKDNELNIAFNKGITMGLYEAIDLIKQQSIAFQIPLEELGLDDYVIENYL